MHKNRQDNIPDALCVPSFLDRRRLAGRIKLSLRAVCALKGIYKVEHLKNAERSPRRAETLLPD